MFKVKTQNQALISTAFTELPVFIDDFCGGRLKKPTVVGESFYFDQTLSCDLMFE